jgi:ABC-2 type transport system permease protein
MVEPLRTLRWSTWLGWQVESNWANPWLFALYMVVKPVTGSLMLVAMFYAADAAAAVTRRPGVPAELLPYVYVSSACFGLVGSVMFGMSSVVLTDRENYRMLKFIFISPAKFQMYFLGRGLAKAAEGSLGGLITLLFGLFVPGIRSGLSFDRIDWPWLIAYFAVGFVMLWAAGMILASAVLNMTRNSMFLSEGVAGVVFFLSGVVFPLAILPGWLQALSRALPTTYWLEGVRRSLLGPPPPGPLQGLSNGEILGLLAASTVLLVAVSQSYYRWSVRRAWHRGRIEETTGA